jgi:hypothetical protein
MTMTNEITNDQDIIDSRDIIERIEELSSYAPSEISKEDLAELLSLKVLAEEAEPESSDWQHGETLIRRSYFVDYVMDMLADCGDLPRNMPWYIKIDKEATASNIEQDYASVDFDGVEYLIRSC